MAALEVAKVIFWLKKFDFWLSEFQCAWPWESPRDPPDVIAKTQETKSHSTARYVYLIIIMDNEKNVKLGDINDLQKTYGSEWYPDRWYNLFHKQAWSITIYMIWSYDPPKNKARLFVL